MKYIHFLRAGRYMNWQGRCGFLLILFGEALILARLRPLSDFYFPFVWLGYILFVDAAVLQQRGRSLIRSSPRSFMAMFPVSAAIWWLFELFDQVVHNWIYVGGKKFAGAPFVIVATVDFSTVLPAVWVTALFISHLLPKQTEGSRRGGTVPLWLLAAQFLAGLTCLILPLLLPRFAFGLIWVSMWFLLDPVNNYLQRPSIIGFLYHREWRTPMCFAFGALVCGFFWEAWNYWSMPKWIYNIPYVGFLHIFEMPLLGWSGYLPFGLELFVLTNFIFPLLKLNPLTPDTALETRSSRSASFAAPSSATVPSTRSLPGDSNPL